MQSIRVVACETAIHCVHPSHLACTGYRTQHTPTSVSCVSHAFLGQSCQDRRDCQQAYRAESLRFPECNRTQTETGRLTRHTAEKLSRGAAISMHAAPRSFFLCAHSHARAHTHTYNNLPKLMHIFAVLKLDFVARACGVVDPDGQKAHRLTVEVMPELVCRLAALEPHCTARHTRIGGAKVVTTHGTPLPLVCHLHATAERIAVEEARASRR